MSHLRRPLSLTGEEVLGLRAALPLVLVRRVEVEAVVDVDLLAAADGTHHPDHLVVLQHLRRDDAFGSSRTS